MPCDCLAPNWPAVMLQTKPHHAAGSCRAPRYGRRSGVGAFDAAASAMSKSSCPGRGPSGEGNIVEALVRAVVEGVFMFRDGLVG